MVGINEGYLSREEAEKDLKELKNVFSDAQDYKVKGGDGTLVFQKIKYLQDHIDRNSIIPLN